MSIIIVALSKILNNFLLLSSSHKIEETEELCKPKGPFDISNLPQNVFIEILKKLDYQDYVKFESTCKFIANRLKEAGELPIFFRTSTIFIDLGNATISKGEPYDADVDQQKRIMPWRELIKNKVKVSANWLKTEDYVEGYKLDKLNELFEMINCRVQQIFIDNGLDCEPKSLELLIKILKPYEISFWKFLPKEYFTNNLLENLERVRVIKSDISDEELLAVKSYNHLYCKSDNITSNGLNELLKEWQQGERDFDDIRVDFESKLHPFESILEGLSVNPIWTPDFHYQSCISQIPLKEFDQSGDPTHFYSIWRSDNIYDPLFIEIKSNSFRAYKSTGLNEFQLLIYHLDEYQHYEVTGKCKWCRHRIREESRYFVVYYREEFTSCIHRRKYSIQKLKKAMPNGWKALMLSIKAGRYLISSLLYPKIAINSAPTRRRRKILGRDLFEDEPLLNLIINS